MYYNALIRYNMYNSVGYGLNSHEISVFKTEGEMTEGQVPRIPCLRARNITKLFKLMEIYKVLNGRSIYASSGVIFWKTLGLAINQDHFITDKELSERNKHWGKHWREALTSQDFILDFDIRAKDSSLIPVHNEVRDFCGILDDNKVPYGVMFSGKKGFHIRIPAELIDRAWIDIPRAEYQKRFVKIGKRLKEFNSLRFLDLSTLYSRQPVKIPYSIHDDTGHVALPLENIDDFDVKHLDMFEPKNVLKLKLRGYENRKGLNRGLCLKDGKIKSLKKFLNVFCED